MIPESKDECICKVVRGVARSLTNAYDKALAPSGLRTTQYTLLSVLARQQTATINQLSELMGLDQTTATRNVGVLEDDGLIVRVAHHDPRVKLLRLTAKGKRKRQLAVECWRKMQEHVSSSIAAEEWQTFQKVLNTIEDRCNEWD